MVDTNCMGAKRPFPFVVFPERVVIGKFTSVSSSVRFVSSLDSSQNSDHGIFFSSSTDMIDRVASNPVVCSWQRSADMADPEGADHLSDEHDR
jgi:hypothetical protein